MAMETALFPSPQRGSASTALRNWAKSRQLPGYFDLAEETGETASELILFKKLSIQTPRRTHLFRRRRAENLME